MQTTEEKNKPVTTARKGVAGLLRGRPVSEHYENGTKMSISDFEVAIELAESDRGLNNVKRWLWIGKGLNPALKVEGAYSRLMQKLKQRSLELGYEYEDFANGLRSSFRKPLTPGQR